MSYCYEDCDEFEVTPIFGPPCASKSGETSSCYPCLPRCHKSVVYCCEKPPKNVVYRCEKPKKQNLMYCSACDKEDHPKCKEHKGQREPVCMEQSEDCEPYCVPACKPVKTKYVIPCYRYEDGRIEQYVPTQHGRLPVTAYKCNGMQDQLHGYRGAIRYLCAADTPNGVCVHTAVAPTEIVFKRITEEVPAVKKKKK